ncbi:hypothetical protein ABK040_014872 [Willaertia magna]
MFKAKQFSSSVLSSSSILLSKASVSSKGLKGGNSSLLSSAISLKKKSNNAIIGAMSVSQFHNMTQQRNFISWLFGNKTESSATTTNNVSVVNGTQTTPNGSTAVVENNSTTSLANSDVLTASPAHHYLGSVEQQQQSQQVAEPITIQGVPLEEYDFHGLQIIHETPNHEYIPPLTFGEEHEMFVGGHVPHSLPHINFIQDVLQFLHDNIGLPWFGCIMATTILFRLIVLPLNISLTRNSTRLDVVRPELHKQAEIMKSAEATEEEKVQAAAEFQKTLKENKCHPFFNILSPLVMAPMFLSVFVSVERICLHDPGCRGAGGTLWFEDLGSIDPTWTLPVFSAVSWLITVEMGAAEPRTETMRQVRSVLRFVAAVMVPITAALPSGVFVYWITSNCFTMAQIYIMRIPAVRRFFKIPIKDETHKHHHRHERDISM